MTTHFQDGEGARAGRLLSRLARAARHSPNAAHAVTQVITYQPATLLPIALNVARADHSSIDDAIAAAVATTELPADVFHGLHESIPSPTVALPHTALALAQHLRQQATADSELALALVNLGNRLSEVGRRQDGLTATEEDLCPSHPRSHDRTRPPPQSPDTPSQRPSTPYRHHCIAPDLSLRRSAPEEPRRGYSALLSRPVPSP